MLEKNGLLIVEFLFHVYENSFISESVSHMDTDE